MFEKLRIKEHMEIAGSDGEHVGTVDKVEGETIKLTKTDSADHQHQGPRHESMTSVRQA